MFPNRKAAKGKKSIFRRTPPPNYQNRSTKVKVFAAVAVVIALLAIWEKSRDPKFFENLFRMPERSEKLKSRLEPKPSRTAFDPPGTIVQTSSNTAPDPSEAIEEDTQPGPAELAWRTGWKDIYVLLDATERTLLFEITAQGRGEHTLSAGALKLANELVLKLDDNWKAYAETAFQSLAELKPDERSSWEGILRSSNERWSERVRPALEAAAQGVVVTGEQLTALNDYQATLDLLNLALIRDDSPLRPDENDIWFRLMLKAQHTPLADLQKQALPNVTYVQVYKQTKTYRGDVVSFRGILRRAWKTPAVNNPWGLKEYYVLWIHPLEGPNAPVIIHLQTLPEGFPKIEERPRDGKDVVYHEDITITGYFFKRQAYAGADGTYTAPLLIGNAFEWNFTKEDAKTAARFEMTLPRFLWIAAGTFAASLLIFGVIYWRVREQDRHSLFEDDIAQADMSALKGVELTPSVHESLKQLEQDQGRKDAP